MIRLATVFSGIGSIEHSLQRMNIEHKIVFACDNGDVDVLSKNIGVDINAVQEETQLLKTIINDIRAKSVKDSEYKIQLVNELNKRESEFNKIVRLIETLDSKLLCNSFNSIISTIISMPKLKKARLKEYSLFLSDVQKTDDLIKLNFKYLKYSLELINDFSKDNPISSLSYKNMHEYASIDNIDWNIVADELGILHQYLESITYKKIIKSIKGVGEQLSMLHEKINSFRILKELAQMDSYQQKKKYIDRIYKSKESHNKVKISYLANYKIAPSDFHWNISFLDGTQYRNKVDVFVGGSPCQSFSLVGKQRGLEDTRGTLFYEFARLVSEIKPKVFIYENVKAVISNDNGKTWEIMQQAFTDLNYDWKPAILNSKDFGIPQNRERLFVVGFRKDLKLNALFDFPEPIPLDKTMQDFLLDNVSGKYYLNKKGVAFVTDEKNLVKRYTQIDGEIQLCQKKNQQFNWHGDFVFVKENKDKEKTMQELEKYFLSEKVKKYVLSTGTKGFYSKPATDLEIARPLLTTMHKMHRAGVDNYVTTDGRLRKLTPRECLRLMGFCDSFNIAVSDTSMYQQAGNSIVVDVLIAIMTNICKSLPELLEEGGNAYAI